MGINLEHPPLRGKKKALYQVFFCFSLLLDTTLETSYNFLFAMSDPEKSASLEAAGDTKDGFGDTSAGEASPPAQERFEQATIYSKIRSWYITPMFQLIWVAAICFLCPGMFNALTGMGGAGMTDATLVDQMVRNSTIFILGRKYSHTDHGVHRTLLCMLPLLWSVSFRVQW